MSPERRRAIWRAAFELARALLGAVRVEQCRIRARIGLGDPADTGQLFGVLAGAMYTWPGTLRIEPVFAGPFFEGEADLCVGLVPVRLVGPGIRLGLQVMRRER